MSNDIISVTGTGTGTSTWASITGGADYRVVIQTPAGTETTIQKFYDKRISPSLYFKFVKSKLQKLEVEKLKLSLLKLQALTKNAFELGQDALYEDFSKTIVTVVRETEAVACGYDQWIDIKDIEKFKLITKESGAKLSPVHFKRIDDYPRAIPTKPSQIIKKVKESRVFDHLWVLYLDYVGIELKTNKEKIRQKDPILFGQFSYAKDKYFFITDWVDEYCDLTLNQFVEKVRTQDPEYQLHRLPKIDHGFIHQLKEEVSARQARLDGTKSSNFRDLMAEEDRSKNKRWFSGFKRWFSDFTRWFKCFSP